MAGYEGNIEVSLPDLFSVAGAQTDVETATKALDRAIYIIETVSGVIFEAEFRELFLKKGDALWVKRATVFQAAWLLEHPDALNRIGATGVSQDGQSVQVTSEESWFLAPMAKRALANCSWHKHGTIKVTPAERRSNALDVVVSDEHPWFPLAGA